MNTKYKLKVRLPDDIVALYCDKKNVLSLVNIRNKRIKTIEPKFKLIFFKDRNKNNILYVTSAPTLKISSKILKKVSGQQNNLVSLIKKNILETRTAFYQKLKFVGVGYRALLDSGESSNFKIKLGYSHPFFYNLPVGIKIFCQRYDKITLYGHVNYNLLSQTSAKIRKLRSPEPYKGKGILYLEEKITLKQGKRV